MNARSHPASPSGKRRRVACLGLASCAAVAAASTTASAQAVASTDAAAAAQPAMHAFVNTDTVALSAAYALEFDANGRLWVGTERGLARYDGSSFKPVPLPSPESSPWISALLAVADGSMWAGTRTRGLYRLHGDRVEHFDSRSGLPGDLVACLAQGSGAQGATELWVGTESGIARLRGETWETFTTSNSGLPNDSIVTIVPSSSGGMWVGTRAGLARFDAGRWTVYKQGSSPLPGDEISSVLESAGNEGEPVLWVGTRSNGLASLRRGQWTAWSTANSGLPHNQIQALAESRDPAGNSTLWIGTNGGGLSRYEQGTWTTLDRRSSDMPSNYVRALKAAPASSETPLLWVVTAGGGVVRVRHGGWRAFPRKREGFTASAWSFAESRGPDPSFWIATQEGVWRYAGGRWSHSDSRDSGLPHDFVLALLESSAGDPAQRLWAGTQGGLASWDGTRWKTVATKGKGLPGDGVRCVLESRSEDGKPVLWVGTSLGLARYQDGAWSTFDHSNSGLKSKIVMSLLETTSSSGGKALWVATTGGGLSRFEHGGWTTFTRETSALPSNELMALSEIRVPGVGKSVWVATSAGVAFFPEDNPASTWTTLSRSSRPSLPDDVVYAASQAGDGSVVLSTGRGVARLTMNGARVEGWTVDSFTTDDGLPSNEGVARGAFTDRSGRVWVGTAEGAAVFDPRAEPRRTRPHPLLLDQASAVSSGKPIVDGAVLTWKESSVSFDYSLVSILRGQETRYRTQLSGLEENASDWTTDSRSRYANLGAGRYEFRVWARDYAGVIAGPVSVAFEVRPAPWRTWWAFSGFAITLAGLGWAIARVRIRTLQRRTEQLEARVKERTAELNEKNAELDGKNRELADNLDRLDQARRETERKNEELARVNQELLESNVRADRIFSALAEALPGTVIDGKYRLDKRVGSGGFAVVFRATNLAVDRPVAVKIFRPVAGGDSARELERFRREGVASCRVDHPNAIQVFDSGISQDGIAYLVMELLEGKSLAQLLKGEPVLSLRRCEQIVVPVCRALARAHQVGIIHRDIKPGNVFLHQSPAGEVVKLVDFGIAKALGAEDQVDQTLTNTGHLLGTPQYMAPERFRSKVCDARADVYSVAVMLYRMLSGRLPYDGDALELVIRVAVEQPRSLESVAPDIPKQVAELVMRGLSKDVDERPTAEEFGGTLARIVEQLEAAGYDPDTVRCLAGGTGADDGETAREADSATEQSIADPFTNATPTRESE